MSAIGHHQKQSIHTSPLTDKHDYIVTLRVIKGVNILMDYPINQLTWTNITLFNYLISLADCRNTRNTTSICLSVCLSVRPSVCLSFLPSFLHSFHYLSTTLKATEAEALKCLNKYYINKIRQDTHFNQTNLPTYLPTYQHHQ